MDHTLTLHPAGEEEEERRCGWVERLKKVNGRSWMNYDKTEEEEEVGESTELSRLSVLKFFSRLVVS